MSTKATRTMMLILLSALCLLLSGCSGTIDESILTKPADYSINISLPYATVTPPPVIGDKEAPLVIDPEGGVIVNDSATILQNIVAETDEDESNYKSLTLGNTGLAVQALQARLKELGYFTEDISGIFDESTEIAVRRFEQSYGTMQTGVATSRLQARLFSASAPVYGSEEYTEAVIAQYTILQRGDVGSSVYALQQRLKNLGYPLEDLSGAFDNETANAVMLFYEAYGLTASDVANVAMQMELYSDSAKAYTSSRNEQSISSNEVMWLQNRLIQLGYFSGTVTGEFDQKTQTAVKLFEEYSGQLPSGELNSTLRAMLESETAPRFQDFGKQYGNMLEGSSGENVLLMQQRLVALGFATGTPNGEYGSATSASLKLFQKMNGLDENGIASAYTQAVLYSSFALDINGQSLAVVVPDSTDDVDEGDQHAAINLDETLVLGSTGDDVKRLQERLTNLGYVSSLTGTYDNLTSRAVSAIQEDIGLEPSGTADGHLQLFIFCNAAPNNGMPFHAQKANLRNLALNDSGEDVSSLQKRLWELGLLEKEAVANSVGVFNEATEAAVRKVQSVLDYEAVNGVAGAALQSYLYSDRCTPETFAE